MGKAFDKSQPYGEVYGAEGGMRYIQNDTLYNMQGEPILQDSPAEEAPAAPKRKASRPAKPKPVTVEPESLLPGGGLLSAENQVVAQLDELGAQ